MSARFVFILLLFISSNQLFAQLWIPGSLGGEIIYNISSQTGNNGMFNFRWNRYRNCSKYPANSYSLGVYNYPISSINGWQMSQITNIHLCGAQCANFNGGGPFFEGIYTKEVLFFDNNIWNPTPAPIPFMGSPPLDGWVLCSHQALRDSSIQNIIFDTLPLITTRNTLVTFTRIHPFPTGLLPFSDSSPRFNIDPVIYCTAGDTVFYNPDIVDTDGDSIFVSWAPHIGGVALNPTLGGTNFWPINGLPSYYSSSLNITLKLDTVTYAPGYSYTSPLPDTSFNSANIPATLNPATGEIYFCCNNPGNYSAAVKVSSYRNGHILCDVHREIFISVFPPDSNNDPKILTAGAPFYDTIYAGDSVAIPFSLTDADAFDWIQFSATGFPLDSNLYGTGGCSKPPCAFFSLLPPDSFQVSGLGVFNWTSSCNHTSQYQNAITYNFNLKAQDNHCPLPGFASQKISITVIKPPPLDAAPLHCASVDSFGNVLLSWSAAVDTTGFSFKKYRLWASDSLYGSYYLVDSSSAISLSSFWHQGAGADTDTVFYFLETLSSCNPIISSCSDTIATIFVNIANSGTGIASLWWNDIRDSSSLGAFYLIYRSINNQPFVLLNSSNVISYVDTISVCSLQVCYFVSLGHSSGCVSSSNIVKDVFEDLIAPAPLSWDTISIDHNSNPNIAWRASSSTDVVAYLIYSAGVVVDTVFLNSSFSDTSIVVDEAGICYQIAALDSCGNQSTISQNHCSIRLSAQINSCAQSITISWHQNQDTVVMGYMLFYRENNGSEVLLANLGTSDSVFVHSSLNATSSYCYFVRASLSWGRSASSNRFCILADFSPKENYTYLRVATVAGGDLVRLKIQSDTSVAVQDFVIQRWTKGMPDFAALATIPSQGLSLWYFNDVSAVVNQRSYAYRIISVDSCLQQDTSNVGHTILLSTHVLADNINALKWNNYEQWQAGVDYYLIHRILENTEVFPSIFVPESGLSSYSYDDDVTQYANNSSKFCYYIEALEAAGNTITNSFDTSFSNLSCLSREPNIFIPSAFHPGGGFNEVFKPVIPFIYGNRYQMLIYNRWGQKIFESHDINIGWDGNYKGSPAPAQAYVYIIQLYDEMGKEINRSGSVVLIR